jgi:hypothetical protein
MNQKETTPILNEEQKFYIRQKISSLIHLFAKEAFLFHKKNDFQQRNFYLDLISTCIDKLITLQINLFEIEYEITCLAIRNFRHDFETINWFIARIFDNYHNII